MTFLKVGAKMRSVAATVVGLLFVTVLIAQVVPGGPFEWLLAAIHQWRVPDRGTWVR
jgi:ABC-type microcin C transport system permease subunit YejB